MDDAFRKASQLLQRGDAAQAESLLRDEIRKNPRAAVCLGLLGLVLAQTGRLVESSDFLQRAVSEEPDNLSHNYTLANVLLMQGRHEAALPFHEAATRLAPTNYWALVNHGVSLSGLGRHEQAMTRFRQAIAVQDSHPIAWLNLGNSQRETGQADAAMRSYDEALKRAPDFADVHYNRGVALHALRRIDESVASYKTAIRLKKDYAEAYYNLGEILREQRMVGEAARVFEELHAFAPHFHQVRGQLLHARLDGCNWRDLEPLIAQISDDIRAGRNSVQPFVLQAVCDSEELLAQCARRYCATLFPPSPSDIAEGSTPVSDFTTRPRLANAARKIRIGYLCGEFREQATSLLLAGVYEHHDRDRFSIHAFDSGYDDASPMRKRLEAAFDEFVDISTMSDRQAASAIRARGIDILVNLNGFFGFSRQGIFAMRPAPVQVNYLGFPGTIGASYMDYLIADRVVIPESSELHYTEKILAMPRCYQPNDAAREISATEYSREELGLPATGFVYCCFNNNYKILPDQFALWMRILACVEGSVLWLLKDNGDAETNLRREATRHGIDPARLVFAPRWPVREHLARHRCADLFLDTLPYNAHTTASDALWSGLPLLTCRGTTFPGRVAASLLHALDVPELIADSPEEYVGRAITLAQDHRLLDELRDRIAIGKANGPLFDTAGYTRDLEALFCQALSHVPS